MQTNQIQKSILKNKLQALRLSVLKPQPKLTLPEWADKHRMLVSETSSRPGRWKSSLVHCAIEPMLAVTNPKVRKITVVGPTQLLKTELLLNVSGYYMHQDPSPVLIVVPREADADMWATERLDRMINATPVLKELIGDKRQRDSGNYKTTKLFPGGAINVVSSRSPMNLASRPIRVLLSDEIDKFGDTTSEGSVLNLAAKRLVTFHDSKDIAVCSPTLDKTSRIWNRFEEGSASYFHAKCPHCQSFQKLDWENVKWPKDKPTEAQLYCAECKLPWTESDRIQAIGNGRYVPTNPNEEHLSFHVNALASPWVTPAKLAVEFLTAKKNGAAELQVFINTSLALCWSNSTDRLDWEMIYNRRESYPPSTIPKGVAVLTCGVDTQADRLEATVVGWTRTKQAYIINHFIIHGATHTEEPWAALKKQVIDNTFGGMKISRTFIDSGGHNTSDVYKFVSQFHPSQVSAIKGSDKFSYYAKATNELDASKLNGKSLHTHKLWLVGSSFIKSEIYGILKGDDPSSNGYIHFPELSEDYFKGIASEELMLKGQQWVWVKKFTANEPLDCLVYSRAAANAHGIDRFTAEDWAYCLGEKAPVVMPQPTPQVKIPQKINQASYSTPRSSTPGRPRRF